MSSPDSSSDGGPNPCPVLTLFPFPTCVFVPNSILNHSYVGPVSRSHSRTSHSGPALAQLRFGRVPNLAPASTALILFVCSIGSQRSESFSEGHAIKRRGNHGPVHRPASAEMGSLESQKPCQYPPVSPVGHRSARQMLMCTPCTPGVWEVGVNENGMRRVNVGF